jgi:exopolyphosphatase / guanosine-5'-triphosphate,3'-diphosphate pyrophosphatase
MRCACIDIGSNTTRLLVADVDGRGLERVLERRVFTHTGRMLDPGGAIMLAAIANVADVVAAQRAEAEAAGAERLRVVATAAIRRAANKDVLAGVLRATAGVEMTVLSPADEGRLAFAGATRTTAEPLGGPIAVVDVGGLSTEIVVGTVAGGVSWLRSFPIGSGVLAAGCSADPPTRADIAAMRAAADVALAGADVPAARHAIAVGGSAASLPALLGPVLDAASLARALEKLAAAPAAQVAGEHGLAPERAVLMPAGLVVLHAAARRIGMPLRIGRGGLREGIVLELAQTAR